MISVYTPKEWSSFFPSPEIIIDGGYIYRGDNYYKINRSPIGKIEGELIYGDDFYKIGASPIGNIETNDGVIKIYGLDYYHVDSKPIYYVKDGKVYTEAEYGKIFALPNAHIKADIDIGSKAAKLSGAQSTANTYTTETAPSRDFHVHKGTSDSTSGGLYPLGWLLLIVAVIVLTAVGFFTGYFGHISGLFLIGAVVGAIISAFIYKGLGFMTEVTSMFITTEFVVGVVILVSAYITDIVRLKTMLPWSFGEVLLALFAAAAGAVMASGVSLVCVLIIWILRRIIIAIKR